MADAEQLTLFAFDCGATNWRLYRVEYRLQGGSAEVLGNPQPAPLTSFVDRRLPAMITLNPAGSGIENFGEVAQQQLDDEKIRERIREHFKPCIGSHLETNPLPHQKRYTHTQALQFTQFLLQAVLEQLKQEKWRSAEFDDRVTFAFAFPVHWRYEHGGEVFRDFQALVTSCFKEDYRGIRFVAEPEGAILCLTNRGLISPTPGSQATLVIDIGGSTTDIVAGNVEPHTRRLNFLGRYGAAFGGDLYDAEIAKYIADELKIPPSALLDDPTAMIALRVSAQRLKESLSRQLITSNGVSHNPQRMITLVLRDGSVYRRLITLDEDCFHRITGAMDDRFSTIMDTALETISLQPSEINQVVLVGGGAQLYTLLHLLRQRFGKDKVLLADTPEEIVAQGIGLEFEASSKKLEPSIQFSVAGLEQAGVSDITSDMNLWKIISAEKIPILLPMGRTTVGRNKDCGLLIDDVKVSRLHAEFLASQKNLELVDLGSTNGTYVNSERLTPNQPRPLAAGDELRFGNSKFICQR
jgi:molecular chaperone DnaK (HSP70)